MNHYLDYVLVRVSRNRVLSVYDLNQLNNAPSCSFKNYSWRLGHISQFLLYSQTYRYDGLCAYDISVGLYEDP